MIAASVLVWSSRALALNPALDMSQYSHKAWKISDGFSKGVIRSIAQTPDGYLWLGTEFGLLRFDGVRALPWHPPADQPLPSNEVLSVLGTRDGALWVGTSKGLARWKNGSLTVYPELADRFIQRLIEDRQNTVWVSGSSVPFGRLCAIRDTDVKCFGDDGSFGLGVWSLREDPRGVLWLGVTDGIWRWAPGPPAFFAMPGEGDNIRFGEDSGGELLVVVRGGLRRLLAGRLESFPPWSADGSLTVRGVLRDRDGAVWVRTNTGLLHVHEGRTDTFSQADGLSGNEPTALFEDREGNIWVATTDGLDRFHDAVVSPVSEKQGLSNPRAFSVRSGRDGTLWLATTNSVERWENGQVTSYRSQRRPPPDGGVRQIVLRRFPESGVASLFPDDRGRIWVAAKTGFGFVDRDRYVVMNSVPARAVRSMAQDSEGNLWITDQHAGLFRVSSDGDVARISWPAIGHKDFATAMIADPSGRGVWLGFWDGGIGRYENGTMHDTYSRSDGLGEGRITNLRFASDGALWVATDGGLSRVSSGEVTTLTQKNGLPCVALHWAMPDQDGSLWLGAACGLIRITGRDLSSWTADSGHSITATVFDSYDGVRMEPIPTGYEPYVARSPDGRLWFIGPNGLNVLDPRRLNINTLPPPVTVERIVADHKVIDAQPDGSPVALPALTRDLQIDYTALSLVAPEKVQFRYKLEGFDDDWQDAGNRRQAFYTNLPPRDYRFRVIASNNSGVWNEVGASVNLSVTPAYYQTTWFAACAMVSLLTLALAVHRIRLGIVEKHQREISALNERLMKAQEEERSRISGELHDGVMQQMLAATMMLGTARRKIAGDSDVKATIEKVQEKLIKVGTDIRQLSHDLHPPMLHDAGLPQVLQAYCDDFSSTSGISVSCEADDDARELSRGAALALFRTVQEALGNVAKHAAASQVSVRLRRSDGVISLEVSDDGVGFDSARFGTARGLGLITMRERAGQLNGTFEFDSAPGRGTTIRVTIPFR
jgi:signal transduction histidine kinase/ligand-binding sensor domain-containing protein